MDMKPIRDLNQSTIKHVLSPDFCPAKYKAYDLDKLFDRTSESMVRGQYFEYIALGTRNREGNIPELPLLKNGKKSTAQIRIEEQAEKFWEVINQEEIRIISTDQTLRCWHTLQDGRVILVHGTLDIVGIRKGRPVILDLKLTQDVTSTFGKFGWGDPDNVDQLQGHLYKFLMKQITGVQYDFCYFVFDYKPKPEHRIIPVVTGLGDVQDMNNRIEQAVMSLERIEKEEYPSVPNLEACRKCEVDCGVRMKKEDLLEKEDSSPTQLNKELEDYFEASLNKLLGL